MGGVCVLDIILAMIWVDVIKNGYEFCITFN